jgi:vanillate/4-hydroxybenzoate decarboxylase subunit D
VHAFPRPDTPTVSVEREPVSGTCPHCGSDDIARYPVISEKGWEIATKCQSCLLSIEREPGNRLGPVTLLSESLS